MNASELKYQVTTKTGSNFFSHDSMKFFGDTMRNYGVCTAFILTNYDKDGNWVESGEVVECWELYRKQAVKCGLKNSAYFNKQTFERVHPKL